MTTNPIPVSRVSSVHQHRRTNRTLQGLLRAQIQIPHTRTCAMATKVDDPGWYSALKLQKCVSSEYPADYSGAGAGAGAGGLGTLE